jgi:hypothetical protein
MDTKLTDKTNKLKTLTGDEAAMELYRIMKEIHYEVEEKDAIGSTYILLPRDAWFYAMANAAGVIESNRENAIRYTP